MTSPTKAAELADWHAQQAEQRRQALGWQGEDKVTGPALRKLHADIEFHAQACDSIRALIAPNGVIAWAHPDGRVVPASTMESAKRDGGAMESSLAGYTIPCVAALLRASEGPAVTTDNQSTRAGDGGPAPFGWALVCNNGTTADFRPRVHDFFGAIQEHEAFTVEDVRRRDADWAGLAPHRIVALYGSAPAMAESPCQFAIDGGGNLYRRYREPVCAGCVPVKKLTDKWESARVADFNSGWNACREAMLTAAPHPPAQQAEPVAVIGDGWQFLWASRNADTIEDLVKRHGLKIGSKLYASPPPHKAEGAEPAPYEVIELAQAFEQLRARKIAEAVYALPIGGVGSNMPTPFQAGHQSACEEILHRLDTEVWDHCLVPPGAKATTQEPSA